MTDWLSDDHVCFNCVGDSYLQDLIQEEGHADHCKRCLEYVEGIPLTRLAELVDEVYREYHKPGQTITGEMSGSYPEEIVAEMIQDEGTGLPEAIVGLLMEREAYAVAKEGEIGLYNSTTMYEFDDQVTEPLELTQSWQTFSEQVRYEGRFFNIEVRQFLDELIKLFTAAAQQRPGTFTIRLEEGTKIYRARSVSSKQQVLSIEADPLQGLGPPPRAERIGGRMNAPGVAVFYGGFSRDTCISEIRPPIGSYVISATFEVTRPLRLLDMTAFERPVPISMFDPAFRDRATYFRFLRQFHREIIRPVLPGGEAIDYVPTQVVAEYLANVVPLDGVIYASVQSEGGEGQDTRNVALFKAGGIVEVPGGTPLSAIELSQPALRLMTESVEIAVIQSVKFEYLPVFTIGGDIITWEDDF